MSGSDLTMSTAMAASAATGQDGGSWVRLPSHWDAPFGTPIDTTRRARRRPLRRRDRRRPRRRRTARCPPRRVAGSHPTMRMRSTLPPSPASMSNTTAGLMLCASSVGAGSSPALGLRDLGLEQRERAGRLAHRHRVDEHERVVAVEQLVGEVHAADAEVLDAHAVGNRAGRAAVARPRRRSRRRPGRCCRCPRRARGPCSRRPSVHGGIGIGLMTSLRVARDASGSTSSGWKKR